MRVPGWCTRHKRFEQVRISGITASMAFGGLVEGLCQRAEEEDDAAARRGSASIRKAAKRGRR